jgi:hypothetical protein
VDLLGLLAFTIYHQIHGGSVDFDFDNDAGLNQHQGARNSRML